jgi:hypothetical protein
VRRSGHQSYFAKLFKSLLLVMMGTALFGLYVDQWYQNTSRDGLISASKSMTNSKEKRD